MINKIKQIYNTFGYYFFKVWFLHLFTLLGLLFIDLKYFGIAWILFFIFMPFYQLIFHDWLSHEYVKPKNYFAKWVSLIFFYTQDNTVLVKKNYHVNHHRNWLTPDKDPTVQKMKGLSYIRYVLGWQMPVLQDVISVENSILKSSKLVQWLDKNQRVLYWIHMLVLFALLPLPWFMVVAIYFPWTMMIVASSHDYYFHGPVKGKDSSWLVPLFSAGAWHVHHHDYWKEGEYYGPGLWCWINPGWYFRLLLFK